jgi:hypothetical protein
VPLIGIVDQKGIVDQGVKQVRVTEEKVAQGDGGEFANQEIGVPQSATERGGTLARDCLVRRIVDL